MIKYAEINERIFHNFKYDVVLYLNKRITNKQIFFFFKIYFKKKKKIMEFNLLLKLKILFNITLY